MKDNIPSGHCCSEHKGSCLDLVRNNGILGLVKGFNTTDTDHICTRSLDTCSHTVQEVCHVYHMRLFCRIFNDRIAIRHRCCHHNIDGCTYTDHIKKNVCSVKLFSFCNNKSMLDPGHCTHGLKTFQMLIDRTAANITASWQRHFCTLIFSKQCTQQIIGCTDLLHAFIFYNTVFHTRSIDLHRMTVYALDTRTDSIQSF